MEFIQGIDQKRTYTDYRGGLCNQRNWVGKQGRGPFNFAWVRKTGLINKLLIFNKISTFSFVYEPTHTINFYLLL